MSSDEERDFGDFESLPYLGLMVPELFNNTGNAGDGYPGLQGAVRNWTKKWLSGGAMDHDINLNTYDLTGDQSNISGFQTFNSDQITGISGLIDRLETTRGTLTTLEFTNGSGAQITGTSGLFGIIPELYSNQITGTSGLFGDTIITTVQYTAASGSQITGTSGLIEVLNNVTAIDGGGSAIEIGDDINLAVNDIILGADESSISLFDGLVSDEKWSGIIATMQVDVNAVGFGGLLHMDDDGNFIDADALVEAAMPCTAMALGETGAIKVIFHGFVRDNDWDWTPGQLLWVSEDDPGDIVGSADKPNMTASFVQCVGFAVTADIIFFNPQYEYFKLR